MKENKENMIESQVYCQMGLTSKMRMKSFIFVRCADIVGSLCQSHYSAQQLLLICQIEYWINMTVIIIDDI